MVKKNSIFAGERDGKNFTNEEHIRLSGCLVMQANVHKPAKSEKTPRRKKLAGQQSDAMDMFVTPKRQKNDGEIDQRSFCTGDRFGRSVACIARIRLQYYA